MRPIENIEKLVKKLHYQSSDKRRKRIFDNVAAVLDDKQKQKPAIIRPNIWRIIMKTKITKLATGMVMLLVLLSMSYGAVKLIKIFTFTEESRQVNEDGSVTTTSRVTKMSGDFVDEQEAKRILDETRELKKADKYERTLIKEINIDGETIRIYRYRYTLSNGRIVEFNENERAED